MGSVDRTKLFGAFLEHAPSHTLQRALISSANELLWCNVASSSPVLSRVRGSMAGRAES